MLNETALLYLATWLFACLSNAQNPVYIVLKTLNGFATNNMYDLIQDEQGFIPK